MFGAPSCGAFVLVCLKEETHRMIMEDHLVAVGAEFFLFQWGFVLIAIVAAAIGVCNDDMDCNPSHQGPNNLSNRLANKLKADSRIRATNSPAILGDINRSIEKMSLGSGGKGGSRNAGQTSLAGYNSRSMCSTGMVGGQTMTSTPALPVGNNNPGRRDECPW